MAYKIAADLIVIIHFSFIIFVILGGLLILKSRWFMLLHIPAVIWAALIELNHWFCPLTVYENQFRHAANQNGYAEGFIQHYLIPIIYPPGLTHTTQQILGISVIILNLLIYSWAILKTNNKKD